MHLIPISSYVLLTFLLLAAGASVLFGLFRIWQGVRRGKPFFAKEAPTSLSEIRARVNWDAFVRRGLLTSRLKDEPAAGFFHGLVFVSSIWLILTHALYPLVFVGIDPFAGAFGYLVMSFGKDLAGVGLAVGLCFFLARRLLVKSERVEKPRRRRGFVAMEIFLVAAVVAGYFAEAARIAHTQEPHAGKFLGNPLALWLGANVSFESYHLAWWIHGLLGLGFMAAIAHTPISHILLGPINSAFAARRSGISMPSMDLGLDDDDEEEEDDEEEFALGATKLVDLGQKSLLDFATCLWCGRCHDACPATETGKSLSPKGVMLTCAQYLAEGRLDDDTLIDAVGKDAIFDCVTCGACVEVCPVSINPPETILEFRRHFTMERSDMPDTMAAANRNLESREHPFVGTGANPEDWRQGLDVPIFAKGETEYLLWIGCAVTYEERAQKVARAMVRILEEAGVSYGILEESRCTGDAAKQMGNEVQFVEMAQANIEDFEEQGVQKIITMCAHCFNSFDRYYPELGGNWETIPHSVLIDQLITDGRLSVEKDESQRITLHDPCYLARHNDIVDETRSALRSVGSLVEMPRHGKQSFCCGAGGANYWGGEGGDARINDVRSEEALGTGAEKIATSCPFCLLMLTDGVGKKTEERKVFDIAELVVDALSDAGTTPGD